MYSDIDLNFLDKCDQIHGRHQHFVKRSHGFIVKHYAGSILITWILAYYFQRLFSDFWTITSFAGDVCYSTQGNFNESNRDSLNQDLLLAIKSSSNDFVHVLFPDSDVNTEESTSNKSTAG